MFLIGSSVVITKDMHIDKDHTPSLYVFSNAYCMSVHVHAFLIMCVYVQGCASPHMCEWVISALQAQHPTICHKGATVF